MEQSFISIKEIETGDIVIEYIDHKGPDGLPVCDRITIKEGSYQDFFMAVNRFMDEEF